MVALSFVVVVLLAVGSWIISLVSSLPALHAALLFLARGRFKRVFGSVCCCAFSASNPNPFSRYTALVEAKENVMNFGFCAEGKRGVGYRTSPSPASILFPNISA